MEVHFSLWRFSMGFQLFWESWERQAFTWLLVHTRWHRREMSVVVYRTRSQKRGCRGLSFHVNLPLLKISNDVMQKVLPYEHGHRVEAVEQCLNGWKEFSGSIVNHSKESFCQKQTSVKYRSTLTG